MLLLAPSLALKPGITVYEIRPSAQSRFALQVFKSGIWEGKKHLFLFSGYHGTLRLDRTSPQNSSLELTLEGASAACQDTWVSQKDLQNIQKQAFEMMDVAKHPQLSFRSQEIVALGGSRFRVAGLLNIRGIAKPVTVEVVMAEQPDGSLLFTGHAVVRMKDYGLKPPRAALGLIGTKNEMAVDFVLQARRAM